MIPGFICTIDNTISYIHIFQFIYLYGMVSAYVILVYLLMGAALATKHIINTSQKDKGDNALAINYFIASIVSACTFTILWSSVCLLCKEHSCVCIDQIRICLKWKPCLLGPQSRLIIVDWANKMEKTKCDIVVGYPISSHKLFVSVITISFSCT